jgi:hypothetical protein
MNCHSDPELAEGEESPLIVILTLSLPKGKNPRISFALTMVYIDSEWV